TSGTVFQNYHPDNDFGYLNLFREINNNEKQINLQLKFIKDKKLMVEDLITGEKKKLVVNKDGFVEFEITEPASFKFFKYIIL
ncbi:MAG: hypothetical protein R3182_08325, partial [Draconibacterium sp.]|nr:hypothetical protein [Draconibacterium sp.]